MPDCGGQNGQLSHQAARLSRKRQQTGEFTRRCHIPRTAWHSGCVAAHPLTFCRCFIRNGSKLSPTRSFVTWAVTSAWTAAAPGWAGSPWRCAPQASTSSGSSPSIYNHRGRYSSPGESEIIGGDANRLRGLQREMRRTGGERQTGWIYKSLSPLRRGTAGPVRGPLPRLNNLNKK